ncbi:MAG: hypothetical protein IKD78_07700 [Bacteroidales bacterium]|nr:hypothetical protein [Bacteroidales bacterium]
MEKENAAAVSTAEHIRNLLTPESIAEHQRKAMERSIANRHPKFKNLNDRQIADKYLELLKTEILWNAIFEGTKDQLYSEQEIKFMKLEKKAMVKFLERGDNEIPELHDDDLYVNYITNLEWDEMTDEEKAEFERRVDELVAESAEE